METHICNGMIGKNVECKPVVTSQKLESSISQSTEKVQVLHDSLVSFTHERPEQTFHELHTMGCIQSNVSVYFYYVP